MLDETHAHDARRVFDSTGSDYVGFVGTELSDQTEDAVDRSILGAFAELARSVGGPVADLGCGPGRAAAFLARGGIETLGIDVSPMLARIARDAHPAIPFLAGALEVLPVVDRRLGGAVCWYSIIYTPPGALTRTLREVGRVLAADAPVLLAFQAGPAEPVHRTDAFGSGHPLTSYRHDPEVVVGQLEAVGFAHHATTMRSAVMDHETTPQAFVLARRRS